MSSSNVARRWVVNASPLILLSKVGKVGLIGELAQDVVIPEAVVRELDAVPRTTRRGARLKPWSARMCCTSTSIRGSRAGTSATESPRC